MPNISNSCSPEISGVYAHENLTEISGLSDFAMISLAKPSNTQNLLPTRYSCMTKFSSKLEPSKYSTKKPSLLSINFSSTFGRYL